MVLFEQRSKKLNAAARQELDTFVEQVIDVIDIRGRNGVGLRIDIKAGGNGLVLAKRYAGDVAAILRATRTGTARAEAMQAYVLAELHTKLVTDLGLSGAEATHMLTQLSFKIVSKGRKQPREGTIGLVDSFGLTPVGHHRRPAPPPVMLAVDFTTIPSSALRAVPGMGADYAQFKAKITEVYPSIVNDPRVSFDDANERLEIGWSPHFLTGAYPTLSSRLHDVAREVWPKNKNRQHELLTAAFGTRAGRRYLQGHRAALTAHGRRRAHNFDYRPYNRKFGSNPALRARTAGQGAALMLAKNDGLIIGEFHDETYQYRFLRENLAELAGQHGVDTLYLEQFLGDDLQALVDEYLGSGPAGGMPAPLVSYLNAVESHWNIAGAFPNNLTGLLIEAKKRGVRVVGIDDSLATEDRIDESPESAMDRMNRMNTIAEGIIKRDAGGRGGKYIVVTGMDHAHTFPALAPARAFDPTAASRSGPAAQRLGCPP